MGVVISNDLRPSKFQRELDERKDPNELVMVGMSSDLTPLVMTRREAAEGGGEESDEEEQGEEQGEQGAKGGGKETVALSNTTSAQATANSVAEDVSSSTQS